MLNLAFLVSLASLGAVLPQNAEQLAPQTPDLTKVEPPVPVEDTEVWTDQLVMLLQMICVVLNCGTTQNQAEISVRDWIETYRTGGVRPNLSPQIRAEARIKLRVMDDLVVRGAGGLSPALRDEFRRSLANILEEISE